MNKRRAQKNVSYLAKWAMSQPHQLREIEPSPNSSIIQTRLLSRSDTTQFLGHDHYGAHAG